MASCTFFGHRDCPSDIREKLQKAVVDLIEKKDVDFFYVGNQGQFDAMACSVLRKLRNEYPQIDYTVVLAYMPQGKEDFSDTMLPEGIERVPKRFAISWRNNWMLSRSDFVIAYVTHTWGGAAQFVERAEKQGKTVIRILDESRQ